MTIRAFKHEERNIQPMPKRKEEPVLAFIWTNKKNHLEQKKMSVGKQKKSLRAWTVEETQLWYSPALKVTKAEGLNPSLSGAYLSPSPAG